MFKTLVKSRFSALMASMTQRSKNKSSKAVGIAFIILFILLGVYFAGAFSLMFFGFSAALYPTGDGWGVFTLASIIASALCMFGSIFTTKTQIFESGDNEMLLAMPIPSKYIFLSRITILLIVNYVLEALVFIPAIITYGIAGSYSPAGAVFAFLTFILIPMFTLALSSLIGWAISLISSKMRNKTIITVVLFVLFFAVYFCFIANLGDYFQFFEEGEAGLDFSGLKNTYIFYWIGDAIANGNAVSFVLFALCAVIPSAVTFWILNRSFVKIITTRKGAAKIKYKERADKENSVYSALTKKEIRRFFSSSAYILNAGIGNFMLVILAILGAVNAKNILVVTEEIPEITRFIGLIITAFLMFMSSMSFITAPSISLENNNLWILQSSPIKPFTIFMAKISCHIAICTPCTLIGAIVLLVSFKVDFFTLVLSTMAVMSLMVFEGYFGMFLGLKFPKFDWQNENVAVKQGMAVFGAMFGSTLWSIILCVIGIFIGILSSYFALILIMLLNAAASFGFHLYFKNGAQREFELLKQ